ncbi:MAG: DUF3105 domain-containing protein [Chloroflexota bacterium]
MSKTKRGFQAPGSGASGSSPSTTPAQPATAAAPASASVSAATPSGSSGSSGSGTGTAGSSGSRSSTRAAARKTAPPPKVTPTDPSFLEKYRLPIIGGVIAVIVLIVAAMFMSTATAAPYTCKTLMTPGPVEPVPTARPVVALASLAPAASAAPATSLAPGASPTAAPTPEPQPTQRLGFVAEDMGQGHVADTTSVTYAYCPPTSGQHFSTEMAPLPRRFYGPNDTLKPGNWVHNLEHGYVVLLYKGTPPDDVQKQLQDIVDTVPGTSFTTQQCGKPNKVIAVRFDDMSTPYGAVSWDRALLLDQFDEAQLRTFAEQWQESPVWPEKGVC